MGIKTRLNLDPNHAGPKRKDKGELGTFIMTIIYLQASEEKHVAQQRFIGYLTQGKRREVVGATIIQATY